MVMGMERKHVHRDVEPMSSSLIGQHDSIQKIRRLVDMVADTAFNVLITGETGTGKEVVARRLHERSPRSKGRFVKVNCGALPRSLLESELFGYERGAFTGAEQRKPGRFELASNGVILLDEIGDMPLPLQAKMLEVLQSSSFYRLGGNRPVTVNAWVIASTNHDLESDTKTGRFREDLYYRLNVIKIDIPPLRQRREDIPLLVDHLASRFQNEYGLHADFRLTRDLESLFRDYPWYGNVRELANMVLRLMAGESAQRVCEDISQAWAAVEGNTDSDAPSGAREQGAFEDAGEKQTPIPLKTLRREAERAIERQAIQYALKASGGNKRKAARLLRISYKTLYNKLASLGMEAPSEIL